MEIIKKCKTCDQEFEISEEDLKFYPRVNAPPPERCPACRMQRRLAHRNERTLYRRVCDLCKKSSISIYPEGTPFPVYCAPCWWGDGWDAKSFALNYNPNRPFFDQFKELQNRVPRIALLSINSVNSDYTNNAEDNKNCYLIFAAGKNEDCLYGRLMFNNKSVVDACYVYNSELCYECLDCRQCYNCGWCERCQTSSDLLFCFNMRDSQNCIFCVNGRHKSYCIEDKPCTKEEFEKKKKEILASYETITAAWKHFKELKGKALVKNAFQTKCVRSTGDYLYNCHDARMLFDVSNAKNCAYLADAEDPIDTYDCNNLYYKPELCYDSMGMLQDYNCRYVTYVIYSSNLEYCDSCQNCESCLGCIGLRQSKYCILNKEYSKEDYDRLRNEIVASLTASGDYGSFFPPSLSPHGYNETMANDFWPLTKEEALAKGFRWQETTTGTFGKETIPKGAIPNTIDGVNESILDEILVCEECSKNFRVTRAEFEFYKRFHIPLPHKDFECRLRNRLKERAPRKLWHRRCQCAGLKSENGLYSNTAAHFHDKQPCPNDFQTSYSPERSEIVYCEQCYNVEVA